MTFPTNLRHFRATEFGGYADQMDTELLYWLDDIRDRLGMRLNVTSSGRPYQLNAAVNGYQNSLHIPKPITGLVRAVDVQTGAMDARDAATIPADNFLVSRAACWDVRPYGRRAEVICESRAGVWHWHLGLFPASDTRPSRFTIIRKDAQ